MKQLIINLINGKISAKSGFSFDVFNALLETNVRYSLILFLLRKVGFGLFIDKGTIEIVQTDKGEQSGYFTKWISEKEQFEAKKSNTITAEAI